MMMKVQPSLNDDTNPTVAMREALGENEPLPDFSEIIAEFEKDFTKQFVDYVHNKYEGHVVAHPTPIKRFIRSYLLKAYRLGVEKRNADWQAAIGYTCEPVIYDKINEALKTLSDPEMTEKANKILTKGE